KTEILERTGVALTNTLAPVPKLAPAERKAAGAAANALKREFEEVFAARERSLKAAAGVARDLDLTMPGRAQWRGGLHLVTQVVDEICENFHEPGLTRPLRPEAEAGRYNLPAPNLP